jgi:hypothetical protein
VGIKRDSERVTSERMTAARVRSLLAATAAAAVLAHGLTGHGLPQMSHGDMAKAAAGVCLLLVTVLPGVAVPTVGAGELRTTAIAMATPMSATLDRVSDARSRASPPVLQRFRN